MKKEAKAVHGHWCKKLNFTQVRGTDDGIGMVRGNTVSACSLYMEAVSITNNKSKSKNKTDMAMELSVKDYFAIKVRENCALRTKLE